MMGNGSKEFLFLSLINLNTYRIEVNNVFIYMFYMWGLGVYKISSLFIIKAIVYGPLSIKLCARVLFSIQVM